MAQFQPLFLPGEIYHVYNHSNGSDNIFQEDDNYRYFEEKYLKYLADVVDTLAYCWMKNHFHLLIRVKVEEYFKTSKVFENLGGLEDENFISKIVSQRFSNFCNSYTKAFNKMYNRRGSLFIPNLKRKQITNNAYFTQCILYIHQNPVKDGFVDRTMDWSHSSYCGIVEMNDPIVKYDEVLDWFGGIDQFVEAHSKYQGLESVFD